MQRTQPWKLSATSRQTLRNVYPNIKISTGTRAYVYSTKVESTGKRNYYGINLHSSQPKICEKDQRKLIRQGYALPGNAAANADWVISDRPEDDIDIAEWRERGVEPRLHFRCPHYDTYFTDDIDDEQNILSNGEYDEDSEDDNGYKTDATEYDDDIEVTSKNTSVAMDLQRRREHQNNSRNVFPASLHETPLRRSSLWRRHEHLTTTDVVESINILNQKIVE